MSLLYHKSDMPNGDLNLHSDHVSSGVLLGPDIQYHSTNFLEPEPLLFSSPTKYPCPSAPGLGHSLAGNH